MFKTRQYRYGIKQLKSLQQQLFRFQSTATVTSEQDFATNLSREWLQAKPYNELPTLSSFELLRNFLPGGKYNNLDSTQFLLAVKRDLGSICKLPGLFGQPPVVFTHNVEDFEIIYRNEGLWPTRPGLKALKYHRSVYRKEFFNGVEGLLATQGKQWGTFRSAVNPVLLQPRNVRLYMQKMSDVNIDLIKRILEIRDPETFEVPATFEEELNRWTLESVLVVALDNQLGLLNANRNNPMAKHMIDTLNEYITYSLEIELKPSLWRYYQTKTFKKLMNTLDTLLELTHVYINEAVQRLEQERLAETKEKPESEKSVLEKLIKIDKKIATVMAMDMLLVGVDTTSSALTALLLCLAENPIKQTKLREEIVQFLPAKDSEFTEESLKNMPYLKACIKEALRCYPIVDRYVRRLANDVTLSGYRIPKGTRILMSSTDLLRNENHFSRANEYLPERWLRASQDYKQESLPNLKPKCPFVYLPFGFGPRACIGSRLADLEIELCIARIIRNFHVEFNYPTEKPFKSLLINVPNIPLKFKFTDVKY